MKKKIVKIIESCEHCKYSRIIASIPFVEVEAVACEYDLFESKKLDNILGEIPEWCPLEDAE